MPLPDKWTHQTSPRNNIIIYNILTSVFCGMCNVKDLGCRVRVILYEADDGFMQK